MSRSLGSLKLEFVLWKEQGGNNVLQLAFCSNGETWSSWSHSPADATPCEELAKPNTFLSRSRCREPYGEVAIGEGWGQGDMNSTTNSSTCPLESYHWKDFEFQRSDCKVKWSTQGCFEDWVDEGKALRKELVPHKYLTNGRCYEQWTPVLKTTGLPPISCMLFKIRTS